MSDKLYPSVSALASPVYCTSIGDESVVRYDQGEHVKLFFVRTLPTRCEQLRGMSYREYPYLHHAWCPRRYRNGTHRTSSLGDSSLNSSSFGGSTGSTNAAYQRDARAVGFQQGVGVTEVLNPMWTEDARRQASLNGNGEVDQCVLNTDNKAPIH